MKTKSNGILIVIFRIHIILYCLSPAILFGADILFFDDFENGFTSEPNPVWSWKQQYDPFTNPYGMMYGEDDIYSIVNTSLGGISGNFLQLKFNGRNNYCNTCGVLDHSVTDNEIESNCIYENGGTWGEYTYNSSRGFAKWQVNNTNDTMVCFDFSSPIEDSLVNDNKIMSGDTIKIPYLCDVNGTIGGNISRRTDCDLAINYLQNIQPDHFLPGMTLARRMYIFVPDSTELPNSGIKLSYAGFQRVDQDKVNIIPVYNTSRGETLEVDGNSYFDFQFPKFQIERGKWNYIEEVFTRESTVDAFDGTYKLYASLEETPSNTPLIEINGLQYGDLKYLSIIGNWQHYNDAIGTMFLDDVVVSNSYIGPRNIVFPSPPTDVTID